jgi:hypothetical protein
MKLSKKAVVFTVTAAASAGLAVSLAGAANASSQAPARPGGGTSNCANGIYAGYCGTQESKTNLYMAVGRGGSIVGTRNPQSTNAEFIWFADGSSHAANNDKYAEFAPGGVPSNTVMAEVRHQVVLVTASGAADEKWVFDGTGWYNVATHDVLEATTNGGPVLAVHGPSTGLSETWTFVTP